MKKKVKVSVMLEYELRFFSCFLNDYVSKKDYSDCVYNDSLIIDTEDINLTVANEYQFLNSLCYRLYHIDDIKFSHTFLDNDKYGELKFSAACEFVAQFRNSMFVNFHTFADNKKVDSDVISAAVYNFPLAKEYNEQRVSFQIRGYVHFESYELTKILD